VDIFEALARKGWSGGGLEDLLEQGVDLFANEDDGNHSDSGSKLFSILPQKSILADNSGEGTRPGHVRHDSLLVDGDRYQSLAGAFSSRDRGDDGGSIFSTEGNFNKSRGVRPFSPPPMSRMRETQEPAADILNDKSSAKTVVRSTLADGEGSDDMTTASLPEEERGRERRWSVTDDGVSSE